LTDKKQIKGISVVESLVCMVIIGIGFVAMMQLSSYAIGAMDRSIEKNKLNFTSEMIMESMIGDPENATNYGNVSVGCNYSSAPGSTLQTKQKDKWKKVLNENNFIKFDKGSGYKDHKRPCKSADVKRTYVNQSGDRVLGRINMFTGQGKRKKYLGLIVK
jgi:hypothetical protein|tara:strand:- start:263 stop:742 length:480 start_codon:yes stop_codon:yes gene_type:complete